TVVARDGVPNAVNDVANLGLSRTGSGNILTNDSAGSDGGLQLLTTGTFQLQYGTLVVNANGTWTYTRSALGMMTTAQDTFTYTIRDADNDRDTATLTINFTRLTVGGGDGGDGDGGDGCPLVLDLTGMGIN